MLDPLVLQELISVSVYLLYIFPMYSVTLLAKDVSSADLPDAAEVAQPDDGDLEPAEVEERVRPGDARELRGLALEALLSSSPLSLSAYTAKHS